MPLKNKVRQNLKIKFIDKTKKKKIKMIKLPVKLNNPQDSYSKIFLRKLRNNFVSDSSQI